MKSRIAVGVIAAICTYAAPPAKSPPPPHSEQGIFGAVIKEVLSWRVFRGLRPRNSNIIAAGAEG